MEKGRRKENGEEEKEWGGRERMGREGGEREIGGGDDYCSVNGHVMTWLNALSKMASCYILCCVCVGRSSSLYSFIYFSLSIYPRQSVSILYVGTL